MPIAGVCLNKEIKNYKGMKMMNKEKRSGYTLKGSFHTLELKSSEYIQPEDKSIADCIVTRINENGTEAISKINPNKLDGDLFAFSDFQNTMQTILNASGISSYRFTRTDLRLDNYDEQHYKAFAKLNKYLIAAMALAYRTQNNYKALDLFTENQISVAIKNDYFQLENYDRKHKNKITGNKVEPAKARLEERTTARQWRQIYNDEYANQKINMNLLAHEFLTRWAERWKKARMNLDKVQDAHNDALVKKYQAGLNKKPVQFRSLTDFLIQNQDCIFTSKQMIDLLARLGVKNPKERAKYHKKKYGCEYFSTKDVDYALAESNRATEEYFRS